MFYVFVCYNFGVGKFIFCFGLERTKIGNKYLQYKSLLFRFVIKTVALKFLHENSRAKSMYLANMLNRFTLLDSKQSYFNFSLSGNKFYEPCEAMVTSKT